MGLTNQPIGTMLPVARAWLQPPDLKLTGSNFAIDGYSRDDRAYHLRGLDVLNTDVEFNLEAGYTSPAVNPAFVIDGWGNGGASLTLNGKPVAEGKDFRVGHIERLEGAALVVWIRAQLTQPTKFRLTLTAKH
jgi:hypothetical protein